MPQVSPVEAARRHWWIIVASVLAMAAIALALINSATPTYTAEAQLSIGRLDLTAPGALSGFSQGTSSLASAYSRAIHADRVVFPVARRLKLSPETVAARLSASPVPESPVFEVKATGRSAMPTVRLANAAARALVSYIEEINRRNPDARRLLSEFREAARDKAQLILERDRRDRELNESETAENERRVFVAREKLDVVSLRADTLRATYQATQAAQASTSLVQILTEASDARDDRSDTRQQFLFAAVAAGLVIGLALATLHDQRTARRRLLS